MQWCNAIWNDERNKSLPTGCFCQSDLSQAQETQLTGGSCVQAESWPPHFPITGQTWTPFFLIIWLLPGVPWFWSRNACCWLFCFCFKYITNWRSLFLLSSVVRKALQQVIFFLLLLFSLPNQKIAWRKIDAQLFPVVNPHLKSSPWKAKQASVLLLRYTLAVAPEPQCLLRTDNLEPWPLLSGGATHSLIIQTLSGYLHSHGGLHS